MRNSTEVKISTFLLFGGLIFGLASGSTARIQAASDPASCSLLSLPSSIRDGFKRDFAGWKIQDQDSLSQAARKTWAGRKPTACPGAAFGKFDQSSMSSYALMIVPIEHSDTAYRLLVFKHGIGNDAYELKVLDKLDEHGASNYFIRRVPIRDFFDENSKAKFKVQAIDGILVVDSAENEYGADVYFWSNGTFRHEPVDD